MIVCFRVKNYFIPCVNKCQRTLYLGCFIATLSIHKRFDINTVICPRAVLLTEY